MNSNTYVLDSHAREPVLRWPLPVAFATWLAIMWVVGHYLAAPPAVLLPPAHTIDAQIVELPPDPTPPPPPQPKPERLVHKPLPIKKPVVKHKVVPHKVMTPVKRPPVQTPHPAQQTPQTEVMGARAIYNPLPTIPDDLRDASINTVALARFHINVDGTATVELIQPTPDPRVNRVILATLKTWRFFPALHNGKPIPSLQDIKVAVKVD
jgi:protein TonB